jgi:hypothetical protein
MDSECKGVTVRRVSSPGTRGFDSSLPTVETGAKLFRPARRDWIIVGSGSIDVPRLRSNALARPQGWAARQDCRSTTEKPHPAKRRRDGAPSQVSLFLSIS